MPVKLNSSGGGSVTLTQPTTASDFTQTLLPASGNVIITPVPAGNSTVAPLVFSSGTNLATAAAGAVEYDGKVFYGTPQGTQRGVIPGMQMFRLNNAYTGTNATGAQSILGVGVTLSSSTIYAFEMFYPLYKAAGTTSHTISMLWGGTATITNMYYYYISTQTNNGELVTNTSYTNYRYNSSSYAYTGSITSAAYIVANYIRGTVAINVGGTFIPQYSLSAAPGGAYTTDIGSYMLIYPIGTAGANVNVGTWA